MKDSIKVSILCITYNQAKYIRQALDSFLMQQTDFKYEVLINDDASTDGTSKIIREYQKRYPDVIKPVFHKENQYSKGKRHMMVRYLFPKARGKYLAPCEGDDYWTDPNKLQKQVDLMDRNPNYALCFHRVRVLHENKEEDDYIFPDQKIKEFSLENLLQRNFIQTNSVMYRKQKYKNMALDVMPGDWYLHLYHAQFGKIGFIDEVMSVYKRNSRGIWWNKEKVWKEHGDAHLRLYEELFRLFGSNNSYKRMIMGNVTLAFEKMAQYGVVTEETVNKYPSFAAHALSESFKYKAAAKGYEKQLSKLKEEARRLNRRIDELLNSKTFKAGNLLLAVPKRLKRRQKAKKNKSI